MYQHRLYIKSGGILSIYRSYLIDSSIVSFGNQDYKKMKNQKGLTRKMCEEFLDKERISSVII